MKVFISDIHLTDGTTGAPNITLNDVDFFWNDIQVEGIKEQNIELIILGDFIDCIRSLKWKGKTQPWSTDAKADQTTAQIVNDILCKNKQVVDKLKNLFSGRITYIVGNHDRLIWQVKYAKNLVQNALGLKPEDIRLEYSDDSLGIHAVHGNQVDVYNSFDFSKREAPIGDAIVTLLINRFPEEVGKKLQDNKLKRALQEIDNLRPTLLAPIWIEYNIAHLSKSKRESVKKVWQGLVEDFYKNDFVADWFDRYDVWYNPVDKADKLQFAFEHFTEAPMKKVLDKLIEIRNDFFKPKDDFIKGAAKDMDTKKSRYTLYGHTHEKALHLLGEDNGRGKFYLNTGTWRRRIILGEARKRTPFFSSIKTISYVVFYDDKEKKVTGREFELWDGGLT